MRTEKIKVLLESAFSPTHLVVEDDTSKHVGHKGSPHGSGHYKITVFSPLFSDLSVMDQHRKVYDALKSLMGNEIHSLKIKTGT